MELIFILVNCKSFALILVSNIPSSYLSYTHDEYTFLMPLLILALHIMYNTGQEYYIVYLYYKKFNLQQQHPI